MVDWSPIAKVYDPLKAGSIDGTDVEPHDRAVWRAMCVRYKPNKGVVGDPLLTLFVARLNPQTTENKLCQIFSQYGDIQRLRLVRDIITGFSKGYAFIEYKEERSIVRARQDANKLVVDQHEVFVDFEQERTLIGWVPRRLGGGQGGKKESGQLRFGGRDRPFRKPINIGIGPVKERGGREWDFDKSGLRNRKDRDRHRETEWGSRERRNYRGRDMDDHRQGNKSRHRDRR
ncbi:U11/U12 small nuclear ribonucleoprotein 35 kDa protein-like [Mugil cephalus]|uniref:U11/U12 small nuclear ribonucleoprotein 35 kDa protein-like n=1 Tax=Mugil cephalus TaxID=48193 RepID=UPI001FB78B84|nr:U11/U12 small nuclear ribonucleoprotein 35 kDa protein-like [Mugil cephalus]XP_047463843.1 U11/U12 small nuclear ribonucleoprotein 35 kDa protein-like [Mugil cephalus]XP_047463844.1 U11/U12 small nuclear ribonucleoprotein 35 kDa protein-like [Mugil cephalus]